jgi:Zn-finger nucleic acid-binding protein
MKAETLEGIEIDRCPTCKGLFLDKSEFEQMIVRRISADTFAYSLLSDTMDEVPALCTRCDAPMAAHIGPANIRVDVCNSCGGLFLDQGEFAALQLHGS